MKSDQDASTEIISLNAIRVPAILSRYPVHRLARKGSIKIDVTEQNQLRETAVQWKVSYNSEYGQPGPLAYKLDTLIINRRIEEASRPVPRIIKLGSLHEICRELGISEGKNIVSVKTALYQNASAFITAKIRFKNTDGSERTLESGFTRYSVVLTGEKLPDGRRADGVYIILNDVFIEVIDGAMTRPLDYEYLKSLPPAPQRFYELLSFQMYAALKYDRPRAKLVYSEFCAHAPQTRHATWEKVRSQMAKVHKPHRDSGYLLKVDYQNTTDAEGNPDWIMFYQPGPKARAEFRSFTRRGGPSVLEIEPIDATPTLLANVPSELEQLLIDRGVTGRIAAEIVRDHEEERITAQIERVDWLMAKKTGKIDDSAAYLVSAIKGDYAAPKGFVSAVERQRRKEAKEAKELVAAQEGRRKRGQDDSERAEREAVTVYRRKLTADQLRKIESTALAQADGSTRDSYAEAMPAMKKLMLSSMVNDHIRQILCNQQG